MYEAGGRTFIRRKWDAQSTLRKIQYEEKRVGRGDREMKVFNRFFKPKAEKLEKKKDIEGLLKLLRKEIQTGKELEDLVDAAQALSRIRDERAIEPLHECLREIGKLLDGLPPIPRYSTDLEVPMKGIMLTTAKKYIFDALSTLEEKLQNKKDEHAKV